MEYFNVASVLFVLCLGGIVWFARWLYVSERNAGNEAAERLVLAMAKAEVLRATQERDRIAAYLRAQVKDGGWVAGMHTPQVVLETMAAAIEKGVHDAWYQRTAEASAHEAHTEIEENVREDD